MELFEGDSSSVDIQRNELAQLFGCSPSQINYVLATRFTTERGYVIESRRGGGGYIRIERIALDDDGLLELLTSKIGERIERKNALYVIESLYEAEFIDATQSNIMCAALSDAAINLPSNMADKVRADVLKAMIISIIKG